MKILIVGHDLKFIQFYIDYLENSDHAIKLDIWENHSAHDVKESFKLLEWADIILCEWGLGNIRFYSNYKREHQKLFVRLHRQELNTDYLNESNLDNIDGIITVSPFIYEEFCRVFSLPRNKMKLVYNQVNLRNFKDNTIKDRKYKIGMVGYLPKLKRMDLALDLFELLYKENKKYTLHFKGKSPQELRWLWRLDEEREFYESQFSRIEKSEWKDNVVFEPFGDVVDFYNNMEFIVSLSDVESFHLAAAEGMSCGAIPIISNWEGSETIYHSRYILNDINHVNKYIEKMRQSEGIKELMKEEISQFDSNIIIEELNSIILQ